MNISSLYTGTPMEPQCHHNDSPGHPNDSPGHPNDPPWHPNDSPRHQNDSPAHANYTTMASQCHPRFPWAPQ